MNNFFPGFMTMRFLHFFFIVVFSSECFASQKGKVPSNNVTLSTSSINLSSAIVEEKEHEVTELLAGGSEVKSTDIFSALSIKNMNILKLLLARKNVNLEEENASVQTPLEFAVHEGLGDAVGLILNAGAKINLEIIIDALLKGDMKIFKLLLDAKHVNLDEEIYGITLLEIAVSKINEHAVELLLNVVANVTLNSFSIAIVKGDMNIFRRLLDANHVNFDEKISKGAILELAIVESHENAVKLLLDAGAKVSLEIISGALVAGKVNIFKLLLDANHVNLHEEYNGITLLEVAVANIYERAVELLLDAGAKVTLEIIFVAFLKGNMNIFKRLLDKNHVNLDLKFNEGTLLEFAVANIHERAVELLLDAGAKVTLEIICSVLKGDMNILKRLLDAKHVNLDDKFNDFTLLEMAVLFKQVDAVILLLDAGANINLKNSNDSTVLHYATENGYIDIIKTLLNRHAMIDLPDKRKKTACDYAFEHDNNDLIIKLFEEYPYTATCVAAATFNHRVTKFYDDIYDRNDREILRMEINRNNLLSESFENVKRYANKFKAGDIIIHFTGEQGIDEGGLTKECLSVLCKELVNPESGLFLLAADKVSYRINSNSNIKENHNDFYNFAGRILAKVIYEGHFAPIKFTSTFWKFFLGKPIGLEDVQGVDPELFKHLEWLLKNNPEVVDLMFSVTKLSESGNIVSVDLKEGGSDIPVTNDNKKEYVTKLVQYEFCESISKQMEAFREGFSSIIPMDRISVFNEKELNLLLSGQQQIDIDDWEKNTRYEEIGENDQLIIWFWQIVKSKSFDENLRRKLLQFVTGSTEVSLGGFTNLKGGMFTIRCIRLEDPSALPKAHTCFNILDIPPYNSLESMEGKLTQAITECPEGFGLV